MRKNQISLGVKKTNCNHITKVLYTNKLTQHMGILKNEYACSETKIKILKSWWSTLLTQKIRIKKLIRILRDIECDRLNQEKQIKTNADKRIYIIQINVNYDGLCNELETYLTFIADIDKMERLYNKIVSRKIINSYDITVIIYLNDQLQFNLLKNDQITSVYRAKGILMPPKAI